MKHRHIALLAARAAAALAAASFAGASMPSNASGSAGYYAIVNQWVSPNRGVSPSACCGGGGSAPALHVSGNRLVTSSGATYRLLGRQGDLPEADAGRTVRAVLLDRRGQRLQGQQRGRLRPVQRALPGAGQRQRGRGLGVLA